MLVEVNKGGKARYILRKEFREIDVADILLAALKSIPF